MLGLEIRISEWPIELRVCPRDRKSNTRQHVVCCYPVHMILINFRADNYSILILFILSFPLTSPFLSHRLGPSCGIFILGYLFVRNVGVDRLGVTSSEIQGSPPHACGYSGRRESATGVQCIVVTRVSAGASFGHLQGMSMLKSTCTGVWGRRC